MRQTKCRGRAAACLHIKVGFCQQVRVILLRIFVMGLRLALVLCCDLPLGQACEVKTGR